MNTDGLPRMTGRQHSRARRLILRQCANYDGGNCLPLDDGEVCPCPQLLTASLACKYFRAAILPDDAELHGEILANRPAKRCQICGTPVFSPSNAVKYCPACAAKERRRRDRERKRNRPSASANRGSESAAAQGFESAKLPGNVTLPLEG